MDLRDAAFRIVSDWANHKVITLTNEPFDLTKDHPTEQAYAIKEYVDISRKIEKFQEDEEFQYLLKLLMG